MTLLAWLTVVVAGSSPRAQPADEPVVDHLVADFEDGSLDGWQSSMSGEYYKGGHGQKGLSIVRDAERDSNVLAAKIRWADREASEPTFITHFLPEPIPAHLITSVSFSYRLSAYHLDDRVGFRVRLRYSERSFTDYAVSVGQPLPAGQWQEAALNTRPGSSVRNVYGSLFGSVREITFRLDDVDDENAEFELRLADIRLAMRQPVAAPYAPQISPRPKDDRLDILYLRHSAEGFFPLEETAQFAADAIGPVKLEPADRLRLDTHLFRGLHFPFFSFPASREDVLAYDVIVMLDVDPYVLTWPQATWIADAVASGAGLLFIAGPNTLAHSKDFKPPIGAVIPVTFEPDANDQPGGAIDIAEPAHPSVAGLDAERLGRVRSVATVAPKSESQVVLLTSGRPLLVVGRVGRGRTALLTTWPQVSAPRGRQFYMDDCSTALLEQTLLWLAGARQPVSIASVVSPPRTVIGEAEIEPRLRLTSDEPRQVTVEWNCSRPGDPVPPERLTVDGTREVSRRFRVGPARGPQESVELTATVRDEDGKPIGRRRFRTRVLSPVVIEGYVRHGRRAFAPGRPVQCGVSISLPGAPALGSSGAGAVVSLPDSGVSIALPTMADLWIYKPGTEDVYHSWSDGEILSDARSSEGLLPIITTEGLIRAARPDGTVFDEDNRIAKVRRTLKARPGGVVECVYEYEFVRDLRIQRMPVMLTFSVSRYAGTPFRIVTLDGEQDSVLPAEEDDRRDTIADVRGIDLTLDTEDGPVRIQWDEPELRAWLRDLRKYDIGDYRLELECPFAGKRVEAGDRYATRFTITLPAGAPEVVSVDDLTVSAHLRAGQDFLSSEPVWDVGSRAPDGAAEFVADLPNLESGPHWLEFTLGRPGSEPIASDAIPCWVVDNLDRKRFFPIISILGSNGGGHLLDEAGARARVDDLWRIGFNTIAYGGVSRFARQRVTDIGTQIDCDAEGYAFSRGMASILEYTHYTRLSRDGKGDPSSFAPESLEATRAHVQPYLEVADPNPRLLSVKVVDEPAAAESAIDFGEHSKRAFTERYGAELRPLSEIGDDPLSRLHLAQFIGDCVAEEYRQGYEIKHEEQRAWDLLLTYMSPGLGYGRSFSGQEDALKWSRHVDRIDFDVYPYFYPASQKIRMVQANFCHSFQRCIAQHLGKPFGFYVELDDRNYPFQINPPEASAECAYTAIGQGVTYLNSFINRPFGTGVQSRPERWEFLGEELPRIRRIGPLLNRLRRPRAPVAVLYPMIQAKINNGYSVPHYTFALLNSAFGDVDLLHEEVLLEAGTPESLQALVLLRTKTLARATFEALTRFVEDGGLLVLDEQIPETDETGAPLGFPFEDASAQTDHLDSVGVDVQWDRLGKGTIVRLGAEVETLVREVVEGQDTQSPEIADSATLAAWHEVIRRIFNGTLASTEAILPTAAAVDDTAQIEVGVRAAEDTTLLVVTNHDRRARRAKIRMSRLPHAARFVCDLREMRPAGQMAKRTDEGLELAVELPARHSTMLAVYPVRPATVRITPGRRTYRPGRELSYEIAVEAEAGRPARGIHLVEVTVTDPNGVVRDRYGGGFAVEGGELRFGAPLAINAAKGDWRIEARLPVLGKTATAAFRVD